MWTSNCVITLFAILVLLGDSIDSRELYLGSAIATDLNDSEPTGHRRKLVIHLGPHKTGTTYFQSRLAAQGGVSPTLIFPKTCGIRTNAKGFAGMARGYWEIESPNLNSAVKANIVEDEACSPLSENFKKDFFNSSSDIIISAEFFSMLSKSGFQKLLSDFDMEFDVHVVIIRADSRRLTLSLYHNLQKHKSTITEFGNQVHNWFDIEGNFTHCHFTSEKCVEILSDVFGNKRVHVVRT